jgi:hypothetical protein
MARSYLCALQHVRHRARMKQGCLVYRGAWWAASRYQQCTVVCEETFKGPSRCSWLACALMTSNSTGLN